MRSASNAFCPVAAQAAVRCGRVVPLEALGERLAALPPRMPNSEIELIASAPARPARERGGRLKSDRAERRRTAAGSAWSARFCHPSAVDFTPGVPASEEILRIELGVRVGRADRVDDCEEPPFISGARPLSAGGARSARRGSSAAALRQPGGGIANGRARQPRRRASGRAGPSRVRPRPPLEIVTRTCGGPDRFRERRASGMAGAKPGCEREARDFRKKRRSWPGVHGAFLLEVRPAQGERPRRGRGRKLPARSGGRVGHDAGYLPAASAAPNREAVHECAGPTHASAVSAQPVGGLTL